MHRNSSKGFNLQNPFFSCWAVRLNTVPKLFTGSGSGSTPPPAKTKHPPHLSETTQTPDIRNTTMPPHTGRDVVLTTVLVPVAVMVLTALILTVACACHWRNKYASSLLTSLKPTLFPSMTICSLYRKKSAEGTYDIPYWDRTVWWKSMKQLLPSKMVDTEDSVRYSTPEVGRLTGRSAVPRLHAGNCSLWLLQEKYQLPLYAPYIV
ncbi:hypothetical protein AMECASPLE_038419 [Ameca splendens]|uniref:Uncharacterized protein n=1 Tax=Ameca splendens TaxID=208324 RepID=A0ABV0XL86_9TELE